MSARLHLCARVAGRGILFDAGGIDSVVELPRPMPAPGACPSVLGLVALRSRVATVLDTAALLGLGAGAPGAARTHGVVMQVDGHLYAFAVERAEDVATFDLSPPPAAGHADGWWALIAAVAARDGETLLAVDAARLVDRALAVNATVTPAAA